MYRPSRQRQPAMCRISIHIVIISVRYMRNRIYGLALLTARVVYPARGAWLRLQSRVVTLRRKWRFRRVTAVLPPRS